MHILVVQLFIQNQDIFYGTFNGSGSVYETGLEAGYIII